MFAKTVAERTKPGRESHRWSTLQSAIADCFRKQNDKTSRNKVRVGVKQRNVEVSKKTDYDHGPRNQSPKASKAMSSEW